MRRKPRRRRRCSGKVLDVKDLKSPPSSGGDDSPVLQKKKSGWPKGVKRGSVSARSNASTIKVNNLL